MSAEGEHLLAVIETEEKDEKEANAAPEEPDVVKSYLQQIPDDHHDARGRMAGAGCTRPRRCAGRAGLHSLSGRDFVEERDV